jgi:hypothetical protein
VDEHAPLCEQCGYDIAGLETTGACPECGRPIRRSLALSRTGSLWQQAPSFTSWWRTNLAVVMRPREVFASLRVEMPRSNSLAVINCVLAAAVLVAPWIGTLAGDPARAARGESAALQAFTFAWVFVAQVAAVAFILLLLTWCEYLGIRFISARRKWRLTRAAAWQVCCHATIGWVAATLAPLIALAIIYTLRIVLNLPMGSVIDLRKYGIGYTSVGGMLAVALPIVFVVLGLFVYELLVHLGVRANRFAASL